MQVKVGFFKTLLQFTVGLAVCLSLIVGCGGSLGASAGASRESTPSSSVDAGAEQADMPLLPSRRVLDFGIVPQGDRMRQFFELRNASDRTVELDRVETTCECLEVRVARRGIAPGDTVLAVALLDLRPAADFTGHLAIEVTGLARDRSQKLTMRVDADVRTENEFDRLALGMRDVAGGDALVPTPVPMEPAPK